MFFLIKIFDFQVLNETLLYFHMKEHLSPLKKMLGIVVWHIVILMSNGSCNEIFFRKNEPSLQIYHLSSNISTRKKTSFWRKSNFISLFSKQNQSHWLFFCQIDGIEFHDILTNFQIQSNYLVLRNCTVHSVEIAEILSHAFCANISWKHWFY